MIHGDWSYVVAGYAITAASVSVFVVRLGVRTRRAELLARRLRDRAE